MERCKFHLVKGELRLEIEGPQTFVEGQLRSWRDLIYDARLDRRPAESGASGEDPGPPSAKPISVKTNISIQEFFKLKNPRNDADRVLVTAYYLEKYERLSSFDRQNVVEAMGRVHSVPEHLDSYIQDNLRKGYIVEATAPTGKEKPFSLTYSGEVFVKGGLE